MPAKICKAPAKVRLVTCGMCRHFLRDTEGPSLNAYTHEYFMGACGLGLQPDSPIKKKKKKKRVCNEYKAIKT